MKFYILIEPWATYVKEAEFFKSQGGLTEGWGKRWVEVETKSIEEARQKRRLTMLNENEKGFMLNVEQELLLAKKKFPQPNPTMTALTEEVGELAKAMMGEGSDRVWKEAVQVAVMALRVAVEGDPSLDAERELRKSGKHPTVR